MERGRHFSRLKFVEILVGNTKDFSLENRVLNASSFSWFAVAFLCGIIDIFQGMEPFSTLVAFYAAAVHLIIYWLGRKGKAIHILPWISIFTGLIIVVAEWFFEKGLSGITLFIAVGVCVTIPMIFTGMKRIAAMLGFWSVICMLFVLELYSGFFMVEGFKSSEHLFDLFHTVTLIALGLFFLVILVMDSYNRQQKKIERLYHKLNAKNKKFRELISTKDRFFSVISHDSKGPVGAVKNLSKILVEDQYEIAGEEQKQLVELIYKGSKKTFHLLDSLLQWAQAESGQIPYVPTTIDLLEVVKDSVGQQSVIAEQKGITVENHLVGGITAYADLNMVSLIVRNLLSNAIKFTSKDGNINIGVVDHSEDELRFFVGDTGIGIPKDRADSLFRPDVKYSTLGTNQELGSGLGLKLCKQFIEKNKGKIWVNSEPGKGSTFWFTLPKGNPFFEEEKRPYNSTHLWN